MRTTFYEVIPEALRREGGFVNHPEDRGGATNWGITLKTMRRHNIDIDGDGDVDTDDVRSLPIQRATKLYKEQYWDPARTEDMPARLCDLYFDMCIQHGIPNAVEITQQAVCTKGPDIAVDGIIGPQTLRHARLLTVKDLAYERLAFYGCILCNDPSQKVFQEGWFNRTLAYLSLQ